MRVLFLLLLITACTSALRQSTQEERGGIEPVQEQIKPEPVSTHQPKKKPEKPVTVIINKTEPAPMCVPLAADERKRIIQALDCLLEAAEKTKQ